MFSGNHTLVMGILNVTPDSFSDGGLYTSAQAAVAHALEMAEQGADIIDIGGQSTRPGFSEVSPLEELERVAPVIEGIRKRLPVTLSVDTYRPSVARQALALGADIINDVTGFALAEMTDLAVKSGAGCVVMHNADISHCEDLNRSLALVRGFFEEKINELERAGVAPEKICLDPGIGFGKTYRQNLALLARFDEICISGFAMLIAASRKRVVGESCGNIPPAERDFGSIAAHTAAVLAGANIVRAHNIPAAVQAARMADRLKEIKSIG